MMKLLSQAIKGLSVILLGFVLAACSDTDGPAEDLVGTAASGAATLGMIYVVDADGTEMSRAINTDGSFKFDVRKLTAPFMLKTVASNGIDPDLYSFAEESNVVVNVTPLTNVVMFIAYNELDPKDLYDSWLNEHGAITDTVIKAAQAAVNANLHTQFTAFSLNPLTYDFNGTRFLTNGTSIDGLLDEMLVDISGGTIDISVTGLGALTFDTGIDITGYDIGGTSVAETGNYTLVLSVSVDGGTSGSVYLSINLPAAYLPTDIDDQIVRDLFSTFYGSVGTIVINSVTVAPDDVTPTTIIAVLDATITVDEVDKNYVATYTYTLNP